MSGTLYLLPTVISEETLTSVIPADVREKARQIDHFLVEAAKTARHYLKDLGHPKPIASLSIVEIGPRRAARGPVVASFDAHGERS